MKYIIDRSKWVCGDNEDLLGESQLLNNKGRMCCLGQISMQCGIPRKRMMGVGGPRVLFTYESVPESLTWLLKEKENKGYINMKDTSSIAMQMMVTNDDGDITQKEREYKLETLALKAGHTLKFTGRLFPKKETVQ